eukprot:1159377-Pelagomonas_calceolata.AAC.5
MMWHELSCSFATKSPSKSCTHSTELGNDGDFPNTVLSSPDNTLGQVGVRVWGGDNLIQRDRSSLRLTSKVLQLCHTSVHQQ